MYANNEIGTIEPIKEISEIVHEKGKYLHVDATAAAGKIQIDVQKDGIDLLTLSSNDLYGPQGAGALYVKPGVKIQSIMPGGGQERGLRSGTENVFAIAGMGEAAKIAKNEINSESERLSKIRDKLISEITKIDETFLTGHPKKRLPHHASFRFSHIEGESILLNMDMYGIQIATGSACSSKTLEPSHVLLAIGLKHEEAHGSMVMTLGRSNNMNQVPKIVKAVGETVYRLRKLSPLTKWGDKIPVYSKKVMDHFTNPRNVGVIENPDGYGKVGNPVCGDLMEMYIKVENDVIKDIKFKTFGCGSAIATSSMVTELAMGKTVDEALKITRNDVANELEGLPPQKMHCSNLAADALHEAIKDYKNKKKK